MRILPGRRGRERPHHTVKKASPIVITGLLLLANLFIAGCLHDDGGSNRDPLGPDLHGAWTGFFFRSNSADREPITAFVSHVLDAITIQTSLEETGMMFTGTTDEDGNVILTDAFDGETWSTFFQPATSGFFQIADFVRTPEAGEGTPPLNVIELSR